MAFKIVIVLIVVVAVTISLMSKKRTAMAPAVSDGGTDSVIFSKSTTYSQPAANQPSSDGVKLYASGKLEVWGQKNETRQLPQEKMESIKNYIRTSGVLAPVVRPELQPAQQDETTAYTVSLDGKTNNIEYGDYHDQLAELEKMISE